MHLSENDAVLISVCETLNYIHQDTKSTPLIALCKRTLITVILTISRDACGGGYS